MNRQLNFFNYEQSYTYYTQQIMSIRQAKIHGETIIVKPVLLVAIIDAIDNRVFINNQFVINDWLEGRYNMLMAKYVKHSQFDEKTDISKPFWHLESDGFWHLNYHGEQLSKSRTPTKVWLKENVKFGFFDEPLWILLQNKEWRMRLRDYIVEHKLTDNRYWGKIASEGLGALVTLLFVA